MKIQQQQKQIEEKKSVEPEVEMTNTVIPRRKNISELLEISKEKVSEHKDSMISIEEEEKVPNEPVVPETTNQTSFRTRITTTKDQERPNIV